MESSHSTLAESDVRRIVRLLGEVSVAPGEIHDKRRLLMDGLCELIDATAWVWSMSQFHPDKPPSSIGLIHGGFDEARLAMLFEAINHPASTPSASIGHSANRRSTSGKPRSLTSF